MNPFTAIWRAGRAPGKPVSRKRHAAGMAALLLVVGAIVGYQWITDEGRLQRYAQQWLEDFTGGEASIGRVRLDLPAGLHLVDVRIATPASAKFNPYDNSFEARTIFRSSAVFLRLQPLSLLTGHLMVPEIVAVGPEVTLLHREGDGAGNWETLFQTQREAEPEGRTGPLPVIRLRNARLLQYHLDAQGQAGGTSQSIEAVAYPAAGKPGTYQINLSRINSRAGSGEMEADSVRVELDLDRPAVSGSLPAMTIDELTYTAPPEVTRWFDLLGLEGKVRVDRFSYAPGEGGTAQATVSDADFAIPANPEDEQTPPALRYLSFKSFSGTLEADDTQATFDFQGRFRDAPLRVKGKILRTPGATTLAELGFEVELSMEDAPLPREDSPLESEVRFIQQIFHLREFCRDYDALGKADLSLKLAKGVGREETIRLVSGVMEPKGASARYFRFPYRVYDVTGRVLFLENGNIELHDLGGVHDQGSVQINGWFGGYRSDVAQLSVTGHNLRLDEELMACLDEEDRALVRRFNAQALMNLDISMQRADAPPNTPGNDWTSSVDVLLIDGSARFDKFPYPLESLHGRMRISGGRFEVGPLEARQGTARILASGWARRPEEGPTELDLEFRVADLALDELLADALPEDARHLYQQFQIDGHTDTVVRVFTPPGSDNIEYDVWMSLPGVGISLPQTPARLQQAQGWLRVRPDELTVEYLSGVLGESRVELQARTGFGVGAGAPLMVHLSSERLILDEVSRGSLPAGLQSVWDDFRPEGAIRLDLDFEQMPQGEHGDGTPQACTDYLAEIELLDSRMRFSGFPLPMERVNGQIVVTPERVKLERLISQHKTATFNTHGEVKLTEKRMEADLSVRVNRLGFERELRDALPWRLQRLWMDMNPSGTVDVYMPKLRVTVTGSELEDLTFDGTITLHGVELTAGAKLREAEGLMKVAGQLGETPAVAGQINLSGVRVDDYPLRGVTADLAWSRRDNLLRIENLLGELCGGRASGVIEVDYSTGGPRYGVSIWAHEVLLAEFINAGRRPGQKPVEAKGQLEGTINLAGRLGNSLDRHGTGRIMLREAEVFRLPLLLSVLQIAQLQTDDNAFHDGLLSFAIDGEEMVLEEIDLRGKSVSMIGAGRVNTRTQGLDLTLLLGPPMKLPRLEVFSDVLDKVAREVMEVRVGGTLENPQYRTESVQSLRATLEGLLSLRRKEPGRKR